MNNQIFLPNSLMLESFLELPLSQLARKATPPCDLLVVFDEHVPDLSTLLGAVVEGARSYVLSGQEDAISAMTRLLTQTGAKRLAIVAHGEPGVLHIGASPLDQKQLQANAGLLQEWGVEEIVLYSCEVAKDAEGQGFVAKLSELTGAGIAASTTKTGSAALGGDWQLQVQMGRVSTPLVFQTERLATYQAILAVGDLDLTFGTGGKVTTEFNLGFDEARAVVVQPDGKILVAGTASKSSGGRTTGLSEDFALVRYNTNGSLDTSFGTGGKVTTDFNGRQDNVRSIVLQPDGKIVVAGVAATRGFFVDSNFFALARYNSDGKLLSI